MNIKDQLLKEHSRAAALQIAAYAATSRKRFAELMRCFKAPEYRLAQRAAWSVGLAARQAPKLIAPYMKNLVDVLTQQGVHPAVVRNAIRILQQSHIPEACHGKLMNACFGFVEARDTPAAIKAFSLTTLYNLSKTYPEIKDELQLMINDKWEGETPAFRSRGRKILNAFNNKTEG